MTRIDIFHHTILEPADPHIAIDSSDKSRRPLEISIKCFILNKNMQLKE